MCKSFACMLPTQSVLHFVHLHRVPTVCSCYMHTHIYIAITKLTIKEVSFSTGFTLTEASQGRVPPPSFSPSCFPPHSGQNLGCFWVSKSVTLWLHRIQHQFLVPDIVLLRLTLRKIYCFCIYPVRMPKKG